MIKLIIFDFDGVIILGSNEGYFRCYHEALNDVGIHYEPDKEKEMILAKWGTGHKSQIEYLLKEHRELIPRAIQQYEYYYNKTDLFFRNITLINGAIETLESLATKYKLAIATGMIGKTLHFLLKKYSLTMFSHILSIDEVEDKHKKPSPYMINKIRGNLKYTKQETVYVGDGKSDVIMAKNAEVTPIVVLTGHLNRKQANNIGVKYIIPDINSLEIKIPSIT